MTAFLLDSCPAIIEALEAAPRYHNKRLDDALEALDALVEEKP